METKDLKTYRAIVLINELLNGRKFKTTMNGDDSLLEPLFIELMSNNYLSTEGDHYVVTKQGEEIFDSFMARYKEYLKVYDIYSCVDIEAGEFAFEKYFDFETEEEWNIWKNNTRFFDVRIAVANFKKVNPTEIVFMSFINENRFDTKTTGWQFDLLSNTIWDEIENICQTAIKVEDLGTDVVINMIKSGTEIMMDLIKKEIQINKEKLEAMQMAGDDSTEYVEETTEVIEEYEEDIVYYDPYYDPYYISPIWLVPLFLW